MDLLFGTYRCPPREPEAFGIVEPISKNYAGQLLHPFRRRKTVAQPPDQSSLTPTA
jgi:sterol desaturase/sphingolipid hydroxylase (fatty acid hydroxylase superfamily)